MRLLFFKIKAIAVFISLVLIATCGVSLNVDETTPSRQDLRNQEQEQPTVIIYSTGWCGYCTKAKEFMTKRGIEFIERHPKNSKDFKELVDLAKKLGIDTNSLNVVPIFIIRNKIIIGFNPQEILCILSGNTCKTNFLRVKEAF